MADLGNIFRGGTNPKLSNNTSLKTLIQTNNSNLLKIRTDYMDENEIRTYGAGSAVSLRDAVKIPLFKDILT